VIQLLLQIIMAQMINPFPYGINILLELITNGLKPRRGKYIQVKGPLLCCWSLPFLVEDKNIEKISS